MIQLSKLFPTTGRNWLVPALCLFVVGALAAVLLFDVPVSQLLLVLLVLACPLSHLLLGHGAHGGNGHSAESAHQHAATVSASPASTREYQAPQ